MLLPIGFSNPDGQRPKDNYVLTQANTGNQPLIVPAEAAAKITDPAQADTAFFALIDSAAGQASEFKKGPLLITIIDQLPLSNVTPQNMEVMFLDIIIPMLTKLHNEAAKEACFNAIFNTFKYDQAKVKNAFLIYKPLILRALIEAVSTFMDENRAANTLKNAIKNIANAGMAGNNAADILQLILRKAKNFKSQTLKRELITMCFDKVRLTIKQPALQEKIFADEGLGDAYQILLRSQKLH